MSEADEAKARSTFWSRWLSSETILAALLSAAVVGFGVYATMIGKDRELDIKLVEVGIAILRADPKDENTAKIRRWAIELFEKNSHERFTPEEKAEMLGKAVKANSIAYDVGLDYDNTWSASPFSPIPKPPK